MDHWQMQNLSEKYSVWCQVDLKHAMTLRMNFSKQRVVLGPLAELTASYHRA
jgi:hypothetical protein